jgi:hypothetical protein
MFWLRMREGTSPARIPSKNKNRRPRDGDYTLKATAIPRGTIKGQARKG